MTKLDLILSLASTLARKRAYIYVMKLKARDFCASV